MAKQVHRMTSKRKAYLKQLRDQGLKSKQEDPTPEEIEARTAFFRERHRKMLLRGSTPDPLRPAGRVVSTKHLPEQVRRGLQG